MQRKEATDQEDMYMKNELDLFRGGLFRPGQALSDIRREMSRLFNDESWSLPSISETWEKPVFAPSCNVKETDSAFLMSFDLPGVSREDIKVNLQGRTLSVWAERREEKKEESEKRHLSETRYGSYERMFTLPSDLKSDQVQASFTSGVLKVTVPKSEVSRPKQIPISGETSESRAKETTKEKTGSVRVA